MRKGWEVSSAFLAVIVGITLISVQAAHARSQEPKGNVQVTIVSTNDFHGALVGSVQSWSYPDAVGGAEWVTGYINVVRQENPRGVLWLDAGDSMQGTLISNYFYGEPVMDFFNLAGVNAVALGNHEFDFGQSVLKNRRDQADFKHFLGANVVFNDKVDNPLYSNGIRPNYARPFTIQGANGVKVGIIGVAHPETPSLTNPANISDLSFLDPAQSVNELIPVVEANGATLVVVLAHMGGFYPDFEEDHVKELACGLDPDKVDLIVSGHTHSRIDDVICGIPVVQAYSSGTAFARVDFDVDPTTGEAVNYTMNSAPTTTYQTYNGAPAAYRRWDTGEWVTVVPDPAVAGLVDYYEDLVADLQYEVIGTTTAAITRDYRHESVMGDWVTDIMREYTDLVHPVDFALTNSGGLRADVDSGEITFGEVYTAIPFDNTLVVVELEGTEVRQVLEEGITGAHGIVQVSGLQITFDYDAPVGMRIIGDVIDSRTGLPLDPSSTYYVAVNDFMANGGDDYLTLASNPQTNTYILIRDLVVQWTREHSPFTPPDPAAEQRIIAYGVPPS